MNNFMEGSFLMQLGAPPPPGTPFSQEWITKLIGRAEDYYDLFKAGFGPKQIVYVELPHYAGNPNSQEGSRMVPMSDDGICEAEPEWDGIQKKFRWNCSGFRRRT